MDQTTHITKKLTLSFEEQRRILKNIRKTIKIFENLKIFTTYGS